MIPAEVENVILSHPAIHQVAVVGRPDPEYPDWTDIPVSELPTAYVVKKQGCDVTETDIHNCVKGIYHNQAPPPTKSRRPAKRIKLTGGGGGEYMFSFKTQHVCIHCAKLP